MFEKSMMTRVKKKLTRAEQKQLRPVQILDAAFIEFVKNGYSGTRVEDIAEHVGVTKGTVYVYFETKEMLFEAMIRHVSTPFAEIVKHTEADQGTPAQRLQSLLKALYDHMSSDRQNREVLKLVISEGAKFPDIVARHERDVIKPLMNKITELVKEGISTGQFRPTDVRFPEIVMAPLMTLALLAIIFDDRKKIDVDDYLHAHLDMLMRGLMREPDTRH